MAISFDVEFDEAKQILCIAAHDGTRTWFWAPDGSNNALTVAQVKSFVVWLCSQTVPIVTWNGAQSDFCVIKDFIGDTSFDAKLAGLVLKHVDIALVAAATLRTMMPLRKVAVGVDIDGESSSVPVLWREGRRAEVFEHLRSDVVKTLQVYDFITKSAVAPTVQSVSVTWTTAHGTPKTWCLGVGVGLNDDKSVWTVTDCYNKTVAPHDLTPKHCRCSDIVEPWLECATPKA